MNERQKEQQHVNETIALIHREQAILSQQKQELEVLKNYLRESIVLLEK